MKSTKAFFGCCLLALGACSGKGKVTMNMKSTAAATALTAMHSTTLSPMATTDFGTAAVGTGGLESYKMYIKEIRICEGLETSGTAYSSPSGCSTLYTNDGDDYDSFDTTAAASAATGKFFDILLEADRDLLTKTAEVGARTYNYGLIDWYRPLKLTATVSLQGGSQKLYTKTCDSYTNNQCVLADMGTGPVGESIVDMNNGGTWFKFLKPFTVAKGDEVAIDLAFDLEQRFFGGASVSNGSVISPTGCSVTSGTYCGIYTPLLRLLPVPRKSTESSMVESYDMAMAGSPEWKIRVDLYYNSADADKAILAADIFPVITAATNSSIAAGVYLTSATETAGVTTFKNYDDSVQLTDFTRGDSGTATFRCPDGATLTGCTAGSDVTLTWSARTVKTL